MGCTCAACVAWCRKNRSKTSIEPEMVEVEINISDEDLLTLALEAHKKDITLNALIVDILTKQVERKRLEVLREEYNREVEY